MTSTEKLVDDLRQEAQRLSGYSLDHGRADAGIASNVAERAADAIEAQAERIRALESKLSNMKFTADVNIDRFISRLEAKDARIAELEAALEPFALRYEIVSEQDGSTPSKNAMVGTDRLRDAHTVLRRAGGRE